MIYLGTKEQMERKKMTNKIRASYKQLKDIVLSSDTGIHLVDKNGITIFYNSAAERIDQIKSEEILGASMYDLVKDGTFSQSVAIEVLDKKEVTNISQKVNNKQVIAKGIPIFYDDVLEYVIVYTRDIETLKELSYQLKKIMEENEKRKKVTVSLYDKDIAELERGAKLTSRNKSEYNCAQNCADCSKRYLASFYKHAADKKRSECNGYHTRTDIDLCLLLSLCKKTSRKRSKRVCNAKTYYSRHNWIY